MILLVVTCELSRKAQEDGRRIAAAAGVDCRYWDLWKLDERVKKHDDVLDEFFRSGPRPSARDQTPAPCGLRTVPRLPPHYLPRPEDLDALVDGDASTVGLIGGCPVVGVQAWAASARPLSPLPPALLTDPSWLDNKLGATDVNALLADFDRLPDRSPLRRVQAALRRSAHVLARDPAQLGPHLLARLGREPGPEILPPRFGKTLGTHRFGKNAWHQRLAGRGKIRATLGPVPPAPQRRAQRDPHRVPWATHARPSRPRLRGLRDLGRGEGSPRAVPRRSRHHNATAGSTRRGGRSERSR